MSPLIYFVADLYPWWGIPMGLILLEMGNGHRRRGERKRFFQYLAGGSVFLLLALAYFVFDGKETLRPAMERTERSMSNK